MKKLLSYVLALFLVVLACSDDGDDPIIIPTPQNVSHKIVLEGNAGQGGTAKLYLNGLKDTKTTDSNGSVTLTYNDKNSTTTFDSITVEKNGYKKWVIGSTIVGKEKSLTYSIEELFKKTMIIGVDESTEFDYLVVTKESPDYLMAKVSEDNPDLPEYAYYYNSHAKKGIGIFYKEGLIDKFIIDGYVFLLRNFDGNKVDMGVMDKDGEIIIVEGIETSVDWTNLSKSKSELNKSAGILGWLGVVSKTIDILPCLVAAEDFGKALLYANPGHLLLSMKSAFECGSDIGYSIGKNLAENGFRIEVSQDVIDDIDAFYNYFDLFSTAIDCATLDKSCIADLLGYANDEFKEKALEPLEDANDENGSGSNGQGRSQNQVVEEALVAANNGSLDSDRDGVNDYKDDCPNTPRNSTVDKNGCTKVQLDLDGDGVENDDDDCPNTPRNSTVDKDGCAENQLDSDNDGVTDDKDQCPDTSTNVDVNKNGCASSQLDTDNDGVTDDKDQCEGTPEDENVDSNGCAESQKDADEDGVKNDKDLCPNTIPDVKVDLNGCASNQIDSDNDGVMNNEDRCKRTPEGETVNEEGCSDSQIDSDFDGVNDSLDKCPDTPADEKVDEEGCPDLTFVPDDNLENHIIELGYDDVNDDYVLTSNMKKITSLKVNNKNIVDLTGLKACENLVELDASFNELESVDLSDLQTLKKLYLNDNKINFININMCIYLEEFDVSNNILEDIDLQNNPSLKTLNLKNNLLSSLNLIRPANLANADISSNELSCVQVHSYHLAIRITDNWVHDDGVTFRINCGIDDPDNDGIDSSIDLCPDTLLGESVNSNGCAQYQLDDDNDGVRNHRDQCPDTVEGELVDANGCPLKLLDSDGDGVTDDLDICPNTPDNTPVNAQGCLDPEKIDSDEDGVSDAKDQCPDTPPGKSVNIDGCSDSQMDSDEDGVTDDLDLCPNTLMNRVVNSDGCIVPTEPATNLLENSSAEEGNSQWKFTGDSGVETLANGNNVFFTKNYSWVYAERTDLFQNVDISNADNKYILIIGNLWAEKTVANSITGHPSLWGVQNGSNVGDPGLQGQNMLHTAPAMTWQICSGIFRVLPGTNNIAIKLSQASQAGNPPDGSKAYFDSIELLIFDTEDEAIYYRDNTYKPE